jgi:hypothetical protein
MKEFLVNTKRRSCAVEFTITTDGSGVPIYIVGYDPLTPNTFYFKSRFLITGNEDVTLNCPQSPINLKIKIWSGDDLQFQVPSVRLLPLDLAPVEDPIILFVERFSRHAGIFRPGLYYGDAVPFVIDLRRNIYTDEGKVHPTPARISVDDPVIQVSMEKFRAMSIPERVVILLHEVAHNYINADQDDEIESDHNGLSIYQGLGYPKIEAMNAFADIMSDTDNNYERMLNLINL